MMTSEDYDKLSNEEKRIKVAELCGWKHFTWDDHYIPPALFGDNPDKDKGGWKLSVPDYLNDLNACHEFEKKLLPSRNMETYHQNLKHITGEGQSWVVGYLATAEQRCKAFVLTMEAA